MAIPGTEELDSRFDRSGSSPAQTAVKPRRWIVAPILPRRGCLPTVTNRALAVCLCFRLAKREASLKCRHQQGTRPFRPTFSQFAPRIRANQESEFGWRGRGTLEPSFGK